MDAIVNAANGRLAGGGGVDGAIHRASGPELSAACEVIRRRQGGCPTGQAVITPGFRLKARWIIHTVGPVWSGAAGDADLLASCYTACLRIALERGLRSIAFPNISTGVYGYPKGEAAIVATVAVRTFLAEHPESTGMEIRFVCFDEENYRLYRGLLGD